MLVETRQPREHADGAGESWVAVERRPAVLVADDEPAIVELLRDFSEAEGFAVLKARRHRGAGGPGARQSIARRSRC